MLFIDDTLADNLADLATVFFGDQGVELEAHPAVAVHPLSNFEE